MSTKNLTVMLDSATYSWLIDAARKAGAFPDAYVEELVEQAKQRDEISLQQVNHLDGDPLNNDPANLELRERPS